MFIVSFFRSLLHRCPLNLVEVGITYECGYGCKVMACPTCGDTVTEHRSVYGCPIGK